MRGLTQLADGCLQIINNAAGLTPEEKEDFLANISNFPVVLRDVAGRQTRLRSKHRNGDRKEKDAEEEEIQDPAP
jgi:hypothetical protein